MARWCQTQLPLSLQNDVFEAANGSSWIWTHRHLCLGSYWVADTDRSKLPWQLKLYDQLHNFNRTPDKELPTENLL